jgi:hypothetical protein
MSSARKEIAMAEARLSLTFRVGVEIDDIHEALVKVVAAAAPRGCPHCGLGGVDVLLRAAGDPAPFEVLQGEELRGAHGLLQVSFDNPEPSPW